MFRCSLGMHVLGDELENFFWEEAIKNIKNVGYEKIDNAYHVSIETLNGEVYVTEASTRSWERIMYIMEGIDKGYKWCLDGKYGKYENY